MSLSLAQRPQEVFDIRLSTKNKSTYARMLHPLHFLGVSKYPGVLLPTVAWMEAQLSPPSSSEEP